MTNIVLVCAGGMSTSLMVNKMKAAADESEADCNIVAMSADEFIDDEVDADILLIAPQLAWRTDELKEACEDRVKTIMAIETADYGLMKGDNVLKAALDEYNK